MTDACRKGHDLTKPDATYTNKNDGRPRCTVCRQIRRSRAAEKRKRKREGVRKRKATIEGRQEAAAEAARVDAEVKHLRGLPIPPAGITPYRLPGRRFTTPEDQALYRLAVLHRQRLAESGRNV